MVLGTVDWGVRGWGGCSRYLSPCCCDCHCIVSAVPSLYRRIAVPGVLLRLFERAHNTVLQQVVTECRTLFCL